MEASARAEIAVETLHEHGISFGEAVRVWIRVALLSFGGPAGQIAVMHRILVEEKRWIGEERFLHALNYCMLLPGPEAQQLAVYIGWLLHKTKGGLVAGALFVLPGFLAILGLSYVYVLLDSPVRPALGAHRVGWTFRPVDEKAMQQAASALLGEHDFSSFRAAACQALSPVKTLHKLTNIFLLRDDEIAIAICHKELLITSSQIIT